VLCWAFKVVVKLLELWACTRITRTRCNECGWGGNFFMLLYLAIELRKITCFRIRMFRPTREDTGWWIKHSLKRKFVFSTVDQITLNGSDPRRCGEWDIYIRGDEKCMKTFGVNPEVETILIDLGTDVSVILNWPFRKHGRGGSGLN